MNSTKKRDKIGAWLTDTINQINEADHKQGYPLLAQFLKLNLRKPEIVESVQSVSDSLKMDDKTDSNSRISDKTGLTTEKTIKSSGTAKGTPQKQEDKGFSAGPSRLILELVAEGFKLADSGKWLRGVFGSVPVDCQSHAKNFTWQHKNDAFSYLKLFIDRYLPNFI